MEWNERITVNPEVLGGRPAVKGTRLSVSFILELLAAGSSERAILDNYPQLSQDDIRACLRYASESLEPRQVPQIRNLLDDKAIPCDVLAILSQADAEFRRHDACGGSRLLWQAVKRSIQHIAVKRGWPAENDGELEQVIERLGNETDDENGGLNLIGGFGNALAVRDNANGEWLCESDIDFFARLMPPFIESIFAAAEQPAGTV